ncbi:MAG: UvrB/UvrC motif-containing protein [Gemmatimonadota bacterium]|nr:UvrB/UvrC motif-containing protein [Gemmatimonadota bacterium]
MKTCENCGAAEAVVHFMHIEKNEMTTLHLCEKCAAEKGVEKPPPTSLALSSLLEQVGEVAERQSADLSGRCEFCGLTLADFRETGRFGCPHCYVSFEAGLRKLLRRVHGSSRHVGKVYLSPEAPSADRERRLRGLRRKLQRAVDGEDFERAAQIRDQIRALEPS